MCRAVWLTLVSVVVGIALTSQPAHAQVAIPAKSGETLTLSEPVFLPPDRKLLRMLETAQALLEQDRFSEAVRALAWILNADEDYFFVTAKQKDSNEGRNYRSLKSEARRIVGQLPAAARDSYELQFGIAAKRLLDRAVTANDVDGLAEITRRYFHTRAGYDAMLLLGQYHLDQGRPFAGALCLDHVYRTRAAARYEPSLSVLLASCWSRAGEPEKAREVLLALKEKQPNARITAAGQEVSLFDRKEQALAWLADLVGRARDSAAAHALNWLMFRGNPSRTAQSDGGQPLLLRPRWRQRVSMDIATEEILTTASQQYSDRSVVAIPSFQPLALDNVVLMRTPYRVVAIDFETGKLIWQVEADADAKPPSNVPTIARPTAGSNPIVHRAWVDKTYGTMSSDGDRVFVLEQFGQQATGGVERIVLDPATGRRRLYSGAAYNVLAAYEVIRSQGKRVWSAGGPDDGDAQLAQAFFLGPPLAMQGRLYTIAELEGEVRLVVLNADSGRLLWSQQLAVVPQSGAHTDHRRTGGLSPSFAEGVLICPTGVGAVVAVDLTTRSLLWGYQYPDPQENKVIQRGWGFHRPRAPVKAEDIWADNCAVISGGRLVITPGESKQMFSLSLTDGSVQWFIKRGEYAYLACIHEDAAVVVGRDEVTAIDMGTGKVASGWPMKLPEGSVPSGRGYYADGHYYLPLNSAGRGEVIKVRLAKPAIVSRARSRNETIPGNLICYRGHIISQSTDWLQSYFQLEPLKERIAAVLRDDQRDPWAILRQGEVLVDSDDSSAAVALFREAMQLYDVLAQQIETSENRASRNDAFANRIYARQLLLDTLLERLGQDFAGHQDSIAEIEQLIDSPAEEINFLRLLAAGQEKVGRYAEATLSYLKLVDASGLENPLMNVDHTHTVRLDRWLRSRLDRLGEKLAGAELDVLDEQIRKRRSDALDNGTVAILERFDDYFGRYPLAEEVKEALVDRLRLSGRHLQEADLLRQLERSADPARQRRAVAQLATLYERLSLNREAAHYYEQLRTQWAEEVCLNGKTGDQLYDGLKDSSPIRTALRADWPVGAVEVLKSNAAATRVISYQPAFPLIMLGRRNPMREPLRVMVDQRQQYKVAGLDSYGQTQWSVSLLDQSNRNTLMVNAGLSCGRMDGPLLVLLVGNQLLGIDTLRAKGTGEAGSAILWRHNLTPNVNAARPIVRQSGSDPAPWGDNSPNQYRRGGTLARLGPITPGGVTYFRNRDLVSVDVETGEVLWRRKGIAPTAELFGDDQYVFAVPVNASKATVLSAIDGTKLGDAELPQPNSRWTIIGRKVLTWRPSKKDRSQRELALYDPWTEKEDWVFPLEKGTKGQLIDEGQVALLQRDGRFFVLDLADGRVLIDRQLDEDSSLKGIYVIASEDQLTLVTNRGASYSDKNKNYQPWPQGVASALVSGRIYSLDRQTGEPLWEIPATVKQQGLLLRQPPELPVVVFARRVHDRQRRSYNMTMLFVDKRTGRMAIPIKELTNRDYNFELAADPQKKTLTTFFQNRSSNFTLKFTDKPAPPGPPMQADDMDVTAQPEKKTSVLQAAFEALKKAAQGGPRAAEEDDDDLFGAEDE